MAYIVVVKCARRPVGFYYMRNTSEAARTLRDLLKPDDCAPTLTLVSASFEQAQSKIKDKFREVKDFIAGVVCPVKPVNLIEVIDDLVCKGHIIMGSLDRDLKKELLSRRRVNLVPGPGAMATGGLSSPKGAGGQEEDRNASGATSSSGGDLSGVGGDVSGSTSASPLGGFR